MQRSMTRIRTSHVGRLPPPKGWADMPGLGTTAESTLLARRSLGRCDVDDNERRVASNHSEWGK
jgi:hypothetical protein